MLKGVNLIASLLEVPSPIGHIAVIRPIFLDYYLLTLRSLFTMILLVALA